MPKQIKTPKPTKRPVKMALRLEANTLRKFDLSQFQRHLVSRAGSEWLAMVKWRTAATLVCLCHKPGVIAQLHRQLKQP